MGLLDDAIREHLDLQRRRGADPAEVARAEQEALGPVRRDPAPGDGGEQPYEHEHHDAPVAAEPPPVPEPAPIAHEQEELVVEEPHDEPEVVQQPTTEFRVEDHHDDEDEDDEPVHDAGKPAADEDVLEETPDFLQETPEHDRLWFEQRPPRDFDFDG